MAEAKANIPENAIIFRMGEETGIVIEKTKEQFEHSPFKEQYRQVFDVVDNLMHDYVPDSVNDSSISNIVAFCGDRGEGKTSCMLSVLHMMTDREVHDAAQKALAVSKDFCPQDNLALEMLDPSFFDEKHNIVELVLGQLYEQVIQENRKTNDKDYPRAVGYQKLMRTFAEAQSCLSALAKKEDIYDSMNELSALAASVRLRKSLRELFKAYLEYKDKKRLILCIDDLDLNMKEAYPMAENIRKYLCNEYCIVLMAVKMEQLSNAILAAIRKDIRYANIVSFEQITNMAYKYLTKFIPENNRILMPSPDDIADKQVQILNREGQKVYNIKQNSVKETIVRLIFNKTRYLFYNSRSTSAIVPHNLRDMRQLIGVLMDMSDIFDGEHPRLENILTKNKLIFKNYFYQSWVNNLSAEDKEFACQLVAYKDIISINKFVVSYLGQRINSGKDIAIDPLFDKIVLKENRSHNISVGDVYYVLRQIETITTDKDINLLLFFVRSYYSMHLYELYDGITTVDSIVNALRGRYSQNTGGVRIYKYDSLYEGMHSLQKFLNGSYFTYSPGDLINDTSLGMGSPDFHRDTKAINGKKLANLIVQCNNAFATALNNAKLTGKRLQLSEKEQKEVRLCEYFILTTTHQLLDPNATKDRTTVEPPYIGEYDNIKKQYLAFDFLAVFYNIVNVRYAFQRFGGTGQIFFKNVLSQRWTLTSELFKSTSGDKKWPRKMQYHIAARWLHRLLSDGCIRVSEVQQSIVEELTKKRINNTHKQSKDNTYKLKMAYKDIQDLEISLYPYYDELKEEIYKIPFNFLTPIIDFLDKEDEDDFNSIFMVGSSISTEMKTEFYATFPSAKTSTARKRVGIINALRKDHSELPDKSHNIWSTILTKENYDVKSEWLSECIANFDKLNKFIRTK